MSMDELANVKGRGWEDIDVSDLTFYSYAHEQVYADSNFSIERSHDRHN